MKPKNSIGSLGTSIGKEAVGMGWRAFFCAAAAFNFTVGLMGMIAPEASVEGRIISLLVVCFGIIYVLVARDPRRFAPALWAGLIGKIGVVALLGPAAIGPGGDRLVLGILACDALFALGFLVFLIRHADET